MTTVINKKVKLDLVSLGGNALNLLDAFQVQAMEEGWTDREVTAVVQESTSEDYKYLVEVLEAHCES